MHLLITGTGRAGTSVLAAILTECGLDPGNPTSYDPFIRAGRETILPLKHPIPQLIKSPALALEVGNLIESGILSNQNLQIICPIRKYEDSAASRAEAGLAYWTELNLTEDQVIGKLVEDCVLNNVNLTFLAFPQFVADPAYAWNKLKPVLRLLQLNLTKQTFTKAHNKRVDQELVKKSLKEV